MSIKIERTVTVVHPGLADLDAALAWVVQTCEREGFARPDVKIRPLTWWAEDSPDEKHEVYEVAVSQHLSATDPGSADD